VLTEAKGAVKYSLDCWKGRGATVLGRRAARSAQPWDSSLAAGDWREGGSGDRRGERKVSEECGRPRVSRPLGVD
jgi:hypothetical protein